MKKTIIHFVRHGEVYNPKQVLYGRLPRFPLSIKGKNAIYETGKYFSSRNISAIYTSPMLRAKQTANIISSYVNKIPRKSKLLTEVRLIFQGMVTEEYKSKYQPYIFSKKYTKLGNESSAAIKIRVIKFMNKIIKKHINEEIIVVSHGDPIVIFLSFVSNIPFDWEFKKNNYLDTGKWKTFQYNHENGIWKVENS